MTRMWWRTGRALLFPALFLAAAYLAACAFLYVSQRSLLYFPQATRVDRAATDFVLQRPDAVLRGWVINPGRPRAVLYFGGNGESVERNRGSFARWFPHATVYLLAYRGYGASDGRPSEAALLADAIALHDAVDTRHAGISLIGRSLGSGVATYLASQRPVERLVLITPYDSIAHVAQSLYPLMPVSLLIQDRFDSWRHAPRVRAPVLVLAATDDEVIPPESTRQLLPHFARAPRVVDIPGARHANLHQHPAYVAALTEFLRDEP